MGSSKGATYYGTVSHSGINTCGRDIPELGKITIVITSDGDTTFDPTELIWGSKYGAWTFGNSVTGSKIYGKGKCIKNACWNSDGYINNGYTNEIDARINDGGSTVSGSVSLEGTYGSSCYEKIESVFAATRTNN